MHTAAYKVDVASDRRRRENVPGHILYSQILFYQCFCIIQCIHNIVMEIFFPN